jgi:hypothetical protein
MRPNSGAQDQVQRPPADEKRTKRASAMTIEITMPEVEALIQQRLQTGAFKNTEDARV